MPPVAESRSEVNLRQTNFPERASLRGYQVAPFGFRTGDKAVFNVFGGQLVAGGDTELAEDLSEVVLDGARTDEQLAGDFSVGSALVCEAGDLAFLSCELWGALARALLGPFAGSEELSVGAGCECFGAHRLEHVLRH